jgi:choline dehydrogenase-like flavoprotein
MPNANSRVLLGHARDWFGEPQIRLESRISQRDREHARTLLRLVTGEVRASRDRADTARHDPTAPPWTVAFGNHQMGTARMHRDPREGAVDLDCRMHGTANLFVASSAVFPSSGVTNPTVTIVALAVRLAARLRRDG